MREQRGEDRRLEEDGVVPWIAFYFVLTLRPSTLSRKRQLPRLLDGFARFAGNAIALPAMSSIPEEPHMEPPPATSLPTDERRRGKEDGSSPGQCLPLVDPRLDPDPPLPAPCRRVWLE